MLEPKKLLDDLLATRIPGLGMDVAKTVDDAARLTKDHPVAASALAALLLGTGTGRSLMGTALKIGGLAAVAGLAYQAYHNYRNGEAPSEPVSGEAEGLLPAPEDTAFHPRRSPQGEEAFALTLVRGMIAAARADGDMDADERRVIIEHVRASGAEMAVERFLAAELVDPIDVDALVSAARTDAQKVQLYMASRLAVRAVSPEERHYLETLARALKLPPALIDHVEGCVLSLAG
jgi:uncharacterized membrane protein YebE (DUF533 family)